MVKAAALYIVIIVSLLIAVISASLLSIAFYYRQEVLKKARFDRLSLNLESARTILLSEGFAVGQKNQLLDLFEEGTDSVRLSKLDWGVFHVQAIQAFEGRDTLSRSFFSAARYSDTHVLYLADEDRPLSLSGSTQLTGDAQIPKSGLKQAYVDGKPYEAKELIKGKTSDSARELPVLDEALIEGILTYLEPGGEVLEDRLPFKVRDSLIHSFFKPVLVYQLSKDQQDLANLSIRGNVILVSDTVLHIAASAVLEDVQIYAQGIVVEEGFRGSCQLFARDSIMIDKGCRFDYPSFAGVFKSEESKIQSKISLADEVQFAGLLLSYEKKRSDLQTIISLGKDGLVTGEVFATGYLKLARSAKVHGKVTAKRFIMQTPATLYENYLIDITLNRKLLSAYYLSPFIFKREVQEQKVLKWLH